ncbi:MAG TPA: phosphatase PAP2 family protein [Acidimicrobiales bacterium]|nr:phosphatase PAP2 family protein [Acidimicrobiales bacterium]
MSEAARKRAVEALGGTPPDVSRPPTSPVRQVLPAAVSRRVGDFDRALEATSSRLRGRPVADRIFYSASALGDFSLVWHLVATGRALRSERDEREAVRLVTALAVESVVVNGLVKSLFRRERPSVEDPRPHRLRRPRSSSFPSGHATSAFMAATILSEGGRRRSAPAWYALAAVVAASRVHVRIHHGSDVAAGAVIGIGIGQLVRRLWPLR